MSGALYGGDEVGAIVFDVGSHTTKAGFAGEDTPKAVIPTVVGCIPAPEASAMEVEKESAKAGYYVGTSNICKPKPLMEMRSPLGADGTIEDWDLFEQILNHTYGDVLRCTPSDHPLMMAERSWNDKSKRETLVELMFEKYNVPAFYLCKTPVLTAFANGRSTALVIEGGASSISVSPVYDGFVLSGRVKRSRVAGNALTDYFSDMVEKKMGVDIVPVYRIKTKSAVSEAEPPKWIERENDRVTDSFARYAKQEVVRDFQSSIARVSEVAYHEETLASLPTTMYEFPNGYNNSFGIERYRGPEMFFNPSLFGESAASAAAAASAAPVASAPGEAGMDVEAPAEAAGVPAMGVGELITSCLEECDIDIQSSLWNNIIVSGGATLISGFHDRLQNVLTKSLPPNTKFKILGSNTGLPTDRVFHPWVGGSILASLGSFQQMWISRQEYDDLGKVVVDKKCP